MKAISPTGALIVGSADWVPANALIEGHSWKRLADAAPAALGIDVEVFEITHRRRRPGVGVDHGVEHAHHTAFELGDPPEHLRAALRDERAPSRLRGLRAQGLAVERKIAGPQAAPG